TFFGVEDEEALPASINLRLDRLFLPDEPVSIQLTLVDAGEQPQGIDLSVKPVGHTGEGAAQTVQASSEEPAHVEFGNLVPGLYELTAAARASGPKAPAATHAVFEVVDPAAIE
ncbi:MAG TPA: hypothetical protein VIV15_16640, partial [Anaerolineales bacterium]